MQKKGPCIGLITQLIECVSSYPNKEISSDFLCFLHESSITKNSHAPIVLLDEFTINLRSVIKSYNLK